MFLSQFTAGRKIHGLATITPFFDQGSSGSVSEPLEPVLCILTATGQENWFQSGSSNLLVCNNGSLKSVGEGVIVTKDQLKPHIAPFLKTKASVASSDSSVGE